MEEFLAHTANDKGECHSLKNHLKNTWEIAQSFCFTKEQSSLVKLATLLHDLGKYQTKFQNYLLNGGRRGSVPHAKWGAIIAERCGLTEVSFAIDGHHAGLPDESVWRCEHTTTKEEEKDYPNALLKTFLQDSGISSQELASVATNPKYSKRQKDLLTRFIFSCLTDADWLDTESHFDEKKFCLRSTCDFDANKMLAQVEAEIKKIGDSSKTINKLRNSARQEALQKAHSPTGFFYLNLPTGLGKTLTSFQWALEHAKANNLKRIIIVLPYVNIIDQTAKKLKEIVGEDYILEHHSSYDPDAKGTFYSEELESTKELACENWDYPVIVTTTVQFYESLFSNKPSRCRKFHNIANSVVILDEVQTMPKELVEPTLDMLQDIHKMLNTSFVFCTATMPSFEDKTDKFKGLEQVIHLADNAELLFEQTQRTEFKLLNDLSPISKESLEAEVKQVNSSALIIVNTKKIAKELYQDLAKTEQWEKVYHLSTSMCPVHRKLLIAQIKEELEQIKKGLKHKKILVISTQLIEAGVDLDFPCVFRALAPLESIIQAAGRCNREGEMEEKGLVYIFHMEDSYFPEPSYKTQAMHASLLIKANPDSLYSFGFFKKYYSQIIGLYTNQKKISADREKLDFAKVASTYKIIEKGTTNIFIRKYNAESEKIYDTMKLKEKLALKLTRQEYRVMQQYSVPVYEHFFSLAQGQCEVLASGITVWLGSYHNSLGLDLDYHNPDDSIV